LVAFFVCKKSFKQLYAFNSILSEKIENQNYLLISIIIHPFLEDYKRLAKDEHANEERFKLLFDFNFKIIFYFFTKRTQKQKL